MEQIKKLYKAASTNALMITLALAIIAGVSVAVPLMASAGEMPELETADTGSIYAAPGEWNEIDGQLYYFYLSGEIATDEWLLCGDNWYYVKPDGAMAANEWLLCAGNWYYVKPDGIMAADEILAIEDKEYAFDHRGVLAMDIDEQIWLYFKSMGMSDHAISGIIANLCVESALRANNLQNSYEESLGFTDESYTEAVDNGSYPGFEGDNAGYGLAQWTSFSRKKGLLEFARATGASIGDPGIQIAFIWEELTGPYSHVLEQLWEAESVRAASDIFMTGYERPANQGFTERVRRANVGYMFYEKFKTPD